MQAKVEETLNKGLKREYKVVIPSEVVEKKLDVALKEIGQKVKVPGFRPGKTPTKVLKQRYLDNVMGTVVNELLTENTQKFLEKEGLRPVLQPSVEILEFDEGVDFEYKLAFEITPEFEIKDFSKIKLVGEKAVVSDADIEKSIQRVAETRKDAQSLKKQRPIETGDVAVIDFLGKLKGEPFEGGASQDFPLEIGGGQFIPGFEEQLVGLSKGDKKDVKVSFPKDYGKEELAGKPVVFEVEIKDVKENVSPEINDEFAKSLGIESLEALRKVITERIAEDYDATTKAKLKEALLKALETEYSFELPEDAVGAEYKQVLQQSLPADHKKPELKEGEEEDLEKAFDKKALKEHKKTAEDRVRVGLVLSEVGRTSEMAVDDKDIQQAIFAEARNFPGQEQRVVEYYQSNAQAIQNLRTSVLQDKVITSILDQVTVEEKEVTADELFDVKKDKKQK
ncbi:MAG: trigger factor [Alphaproteobacteria bacterium]